MKRHLQIPGVRPWAGEDLIDLQNEPLKTMDAFFGEYGNCIFNGIEVRPVSDNIYNITPGFVALAGKDPDGLPAYKVVPFDGAENVSLPVYLTLSCSVIEREYADQKVKPVAYDYKAAVSAVKPAEDSEYLEITVSGGRRFVDAVGLTDKLSHTGNGKDVTVTFSEADNRINVSSGEKMSVLWGKVRKWFAGLQAVAFSGRAADLADDTTHRFATDTEKTVWNDKYTRAEVDTQHNNLTADLNTLAGNTYRKSETYTRTEIDNKDSVITNSKAPLVHTHTKSQISDFPVSMPASDVYTWAKAANKPAYTATEVGASPSGHNHTGIYQPVGNYAPSDHNHAGVYQPAGSYAAANHTHSASGIAEETNKRFMTDAERTKLTGIETGANKYVHPATHPASMITEEANKRFMTDAERTKLTGIETGANKYIHPATHPASIITEEANKRFMTDAERSKLSGIEINANNYTHPATHPASMISQDSTRRFVTDAEKTKWNSAGNCSGSYAGNGYCTLPGGITIQWGRTYIASGYKYVGFPRGFSKMFSVVITPNDTNTNRTKNFGVGDQSTAGFYICNCEGVAFNFDWIAIGTV